MILRRHNLFHRIFFHGILLILTLGIAVMITFHTVGVEPPAWYGAFSQTAGMLAEFVEPPGSSQEALQKQVRTLHITTQASLSVYTLDGTLLAHAGRLTLEPLPKERAAALFQETKPYCRRLGELSIPIRSAAQPAYLTVDWHQDRIVSWRFATAIIAALLIIGAMSLPLARSIAKPIEAITDTARKLKTGDLSARIDMPLNHEFGVLAATLNEMAAGLDIRIRREKELLANVSHELRTPLARIRVALEIAAEPDQTPERIHRHLHGITADISELEQLVSDILDTTRLDLADKGDRTGLRLRLESVKLEEILIDSAARFERRHQKPLEVCLQPDAAPLQLDRALIRRVIDNLLDNSAKHAKEETGLTLAMRMDKDSQIVEVKDRGVGVLPEDLPRIFEPFYRAEKSRDKSEGGIGLGLTLSKRIIEAHGGTIIAENREGGGLTVRVSLPDIRRLDV